MRIKRRGQLAVPMMGLIARWFNILLPRSQFQRQIAVLGSGTIIAQALQALAVPLLARCYPPAAFGVWAILMSIVGFLQGIGGLRYELAIVIEKDTVRAANAVALHTVCNVGTYLFGLMLIVLLEDQIISLTRTEALKGWLYLAPFIAFVNMFTLALNSWLTREQQFSQLAASRIVSSVVTISSQSVAAPLTGFAAGGLISGGVLGQSAPLYVLFTEWRRGGSRLSRQINWSHMRDLAWQHRHFPLYIVPLGLLSMLRDLSIILLISAYYPVHVVGFYAMAYRLMLIPANLAISAVRPVIYQRLAQASDPKQASPEIDQLLVQSVTFILPVFIIFAWWAPSVFSLLLGENWREAGFYAAALALPAFTVLIAGPLDRALDVVGQQRLAFLMGLASSTIALATFAVSLAVVGDLRVAVVCLALANATHNALWVAIVYRKLGLPTRGLRLASRRALLMIFSCIATMTLLSLAIDN